MMPFLKPLQEGTHHKLLAKEKSKFCKQRGKLDYTRYSQVPYLLDQMPLSFSSRL